MFVEDDDDDNDNIIGVLGSTQYWDFKGTWHGNANHLRVQVAPPPHTQAKTAVISRFLSLPVRRCDNTYWWWLSKSRNLTAMKRLKCQDHKMSVSVFADWPTRILMSLSKMMRFVVVVVLCLPSIFCRQGFGPGQNCVSRDWMSPSF